jgi:hypothetical protein
VEYWSALAGDRVRESGAHGQLQLCHMSDISLQWADASASTPYRGSYMALRNGEGELVNGVQMEVAMPRSKRSAFRHQFQSLSLQSFTRRLGEHLDNVATSNSRNSTKAYASSDLHASKFTIQSTLLANVRCGSWSLHNLAKHVAKSALLRAKPGYLARKLIFLHQSLYHSTRCYNLKQSRTLAHMFSTES